MHNKYSISSDPSKMEKDFERFREFLEKEYETNHSLIDDYDYEDGFVVLVYKLPSKHHKDYQLIRAGKYSETSKEFNVDLRYYC